MRADATNEKGRYAGIFHLIVRILTLPPHRHRYNSASDVCPRKAYDTA